MPRPPWSRLNQADRAESCLTRQRVADQRDQPRGDFVGARASNGKLKFFVVANFESGERQKVASVDRRISRAAKVYLVPAFGNCGDESRCRTAVKTVGKT